MTLTAGELESYLDMNLGGSVPPGISLINLVNQAGRYLCNLHPWRWLMSRPMHLDLRAKITITGATLDSTGKLLTVTNSELDSYTRVIGDRVELASGTDGTGTLTAGFYEILNYASDVLTLRTAASTDGSGGTGTVTAISAEIDTDTVALPSDFKSVLPVRSVADSNTVIHGLNWCTPEYLNALRANAVGGADFGNYWGCISRAGPTPAPANEPVTWILEITPTPDADERDSFQGFYNAKWTQITTADQILFLPNEGESFFTTLVETFAKGRIEADDGSLTRRLRELRGDPDRRISMDPDLEAFMRWDGAVQSHYGIMRGGGAQNTYLGRHASVPPRFSVNNPG